MERKITVCDFSVPIQDTSSNLLWQEKMKKALDPLSELRAGLPGQLSPQFSNILWSSNFFRYFFFFFLV